MLLPGSTDPVHLTYCLNIHPGEAWADNLSAIRTHVPALRASLHADSRLFGLGLRLGRRATSELREGNRLREFRDHLRGEGLYALTCNGFPYGQFHGTRVKENVYAPDWRDPARVAYTLDLAEIMSALAPEGVAPSISTVPGSYRTWCRRKADVLAVLSGLARAVHGLQALAERTGRRVWLAIEPEPDCLWESTADLLALWQTTLPEHLPPLAGTLGVSVNALETAFREHLAVCFDTCHLAVNFEMVAPALASLAAAGIPVAKVQVSAAPQMTRFDPQARQQLAGLVDPVYLHQTRLRRRDGRLAAFPDLPEALAHLDDGRDAAAVAELRTHFHVPLGLDSWGAMTSTRSLLDAPFFRLLRQGVTPHVELETYTFSVLPPELRTQGVVASLAGEFAWFLNAWAAA